LAADLLNARREHCDPHERSGEAYLIGSKLGRAEEHLKLLDCPCFFGCQENDDRKSKIAACKATNNPRAASSK